MHVVSFYAVGPDQTALWRYWHQPLSCGIAGVVWVCLGEGDKVVGLGSSQLRQWLFTSENGSAEVF